MRQDRMAQPAAPLALAGILYLVLTTLFSGNAFGETPFGMGDPAAMNRAGFPVAWGPEGSGQEGLKGRFPFQPLDRDPTEGIRHGFV